MYDLLIICLTGTVSLFSVAFLTVSTRHIVGLNPNPRHAEDAANGYWVHYNFLNSSHAEIQIIEPMAASPTVGNCDGDSFALISARDKQLRMGRGAGRTHK